jgi:hypothetical protein
LGGGIGAVPTPTPGQTRSIGSDDLRGASDLCLNRLRANRSNRTFSDSARSSRGRVKGASHYPNSRRPMQR